jgi:hypothetical protein
MKQLEKLLINSKIRCQLSFIYLILDFFPIKATYPTLLSFYLYALKKEASSIFYYNLRLTFYRHAECPF